MNSPLKVWGRISSINVRKVVWTAQELGVNFERLDAGGMFGIVKTPEFLALNPNAMIPVIEDGGYVLWESNVIVRYLCAKHATGSLYPVDLQERFDAERWMDWQQTELNPAGRNGFLQLVRTPPEQRDAGLIAESNAAVEALMAQLDAHLEGRCFMVAERFTVADIPLGCAVHRWLNLPQTRQARPNVERWFAAMNARPAAKGLLDVALS